MKIFITGHGRHGKDSLAIYLKRYYELAHESSSHIAMRTFLRDELAESHGLVYESEEECYEDRINHRVLWRDIIRDYNEGDKARLSRLIFSTNDVYVGIRCREEFLAAKHLADLSIWVDASNRRPEIDPSLTILESDCDITINNDTTEEDFLERTLCLFSQLKGVNQNVNSPNYHVPS